MKRSLFVLMLVLGILAAGFGLKELMPSTTPAAVALGVTPTPSTAPSIVQTLLRAEAPVLAQTVIQRLIAPRPSTPATSVLQTVESAVLSEVAPRPFPAATPETLVASATDAAVTFIEQAIEPTSTAAPAQTGPVSASPSPQTPTPHWLVGLNVQGGVTATTGHATGYLAGVQWLKRGTSNTPGAVKLALLSPVFFAAPNVKEVGLLPVSVNVGAVVPHQPFTNLWVSPYVSLDWASLGPNGASLKRVGIALTATF